MQPQAPEASTLVLVWGVWGGAEDMLQTRVACHWVQRQVSAEAGNEQTNHGNQH